MNNIYDEYFIHTFILENAHKEKPNNYIEHKYTLDTL